MKKRLPLSSMLLLFLCVLSACGGNNAPAAGESVTLRYMIWDEAQKPGVQQVIDDFEATHENIDIELEVTPWAQYWTKLQTAATGGSLADVFWMNGPNIQLYASNGILAPISDQIAANNIDMSKYPASLVDLYSYDGKNYALPKDFDTIGLWYNKQLFDAADVAYPDDTWTWESVSEAAAKLTDESAGIWGITSEINGQANYYNTILQNGGYVISDDKKTSGFDSDEAIGGLKYWTDFIEAGYSPNLAQMTDTVPLTLFESGKVAMMYGGSWQAVAFNKNSDLKDTINVAPLPQGKTRASVIHGLGNTISANTQYPEQAWQFVEYLGSEEAANTLASAGTVIPAYTGTQQTWIDSMPQYDLQIFIDALEYAYPYPVSKNTAAWNTAETEFLTEIWAGDKTVEEGAKQLATEMNKLLAEEE